MLEFILFLKKIDKEILELVYKADFLVEENAQICNYSRKFFGFLDKKQRRVIICTRNAKIVGGYLIPKTPTSDRYSPTPKYIRRALRHEAVHVAQMCNGGKTLDMVDADKMKLHPFKKDALEGSTKISGNRAKEYEAYWMEDRPNQVKAALEKYCF